MEEVAPTKETKVPTRVINARCATKCILGSAKKRLDYVSDVASQVTTLVNVHFSWIVRGLATHCLIGLIQHPEAATSIIRHFGCGLRCGNKFCCLQLWILDIIFVRICFSRFLNSLKEIYLGNLNLGHFGEFISLHSESLILCSILVETKS